MDANPLPAEVRADFTEGDLRELVAATLRELQRGLPMVGGVTLASSLDRDLGLDSLGRVELLLRIERAASVALPEDTLQTAETVADLWHAVQSGRPQATTAAALPQAPRRAAEAEPASDGPAVQDAQTLLQVLDAHLRVHPDRTQVIVLADEGETRIDHRRLADASAAIAAGLQRAGLQPRQTVAIMLPTSPEYFFTYFGILRAGGIPVPIYPPARASQLEDHVRRHTGILANAQAVLMISVPQAMRVARLLQARVPGLREVRRRSNSRQAAASRPWCRCEAATSRSSSTRQAVPARPKASC